MTFFGFPKVKWLQYTGKVGKCTSYRCQIFSGFNTPKIIKILKSVNKLFRSLSEARLVFCTSPHFHTNNATKLTIRYKIYEADI